MASISGATAKSLISITELSMKRSITLILQLQVLEELFYQCCLVTGDIEKKLCFFRIHLYDLGPLPHLLSNQDSPAHGSSCTSTPFSSKIGSRASKTLSNLPVLWSSRETKNPLTCLTHFFFSTFYSIKKIGFCDNLFVSSPFNLTIKEAGFYLPSSCVRL